MVTANGAGTQGKSAGTSLVEDNGVVDVDPAQGTILRDDGVLMEDPTELTEEEEDDDDDTVVVAFCGSVMEKYHTFRTRCQAILDDLVLQPWPEVKSARKNGTMTTTTNAAPRLAKVEQRRVLLEENCDGGILGAGILAAVMDTKELSASIVGAKH